MECMQGADFNGVMGDDLFVNQLLDFNGFSETEFEIETEKEESKKKGEEEGEKLILSKQEFVPLPQTEIIVPAEDLEEMASLEWLNHLVEDSFSVYSLTGKLPPKPTEIRNETAAVQHCFTTPIQTKARTKRARSGVRVWPVLSSPSFAADSSTSSSSSTLSTTSFSPSKKQRKKKADAFAGGVISQPRRCAHCGVTKTPQWRAGPLGSKTLCNACGVRFKSGRLLPEYRPACSPTYSNVLHSNNHRKVLEMRRKREAETETGGISLTQPVQSF